MKKCLHSTLFFYQLVYIHFIHDKKSELMLMRCARAYSSSCLQVILVYLLPFRRNSLFSSQKSPKNH